MSLRVVGNTIYGGNQKDLVAEITEKVPSYVQIEALKNAYPNGRVVRNEFYLGSLAGEAGQSLKINIDPSSPNFMRGMDFNSGDGYRGHIQDINGGLQVENHRCSRTFCYILGSTPGRSANEPN